MFGLACRSGTPFQGSSPLRDMLHGTIKAPRGFQKVSDFQPPAQVITVMVEEMANHAKKCQDHRPELCPTGSLFASVSETLFSIQTCYVSDVLGVVCHTVFDSMLEAFHLAKFFNEVALGKHELMMVFWGFTISGLRIDLFFLLTWSTDILLLSAYSMAPTKSISSISKSKPQNLRFRGFCANVRGPS